MNDTTKYLIHASVAADGVVERSDVVGAIFGQTEGLLGDELDLRDLQQSSKVGRIDVEIESQSGQSVGEVTIATSLDKVETATLAAALETITRVGPCSSTVEVERIEDVRSAKRREVVDRAKELLMESFDDTVMSSEEILEEVREHVRVEEITEYEGLPAGPNVGDSDAVVLVEGRSDVLQLLRYGIKNAIAVEGTNVPSVVADLTQDRTVTAFLDADRGGDLILEELGQVADVDYVAFAPAGKSVEDLSHHEVFSALREKVDYADVASMTEPREAVAATDGSATPAPETDDEGDGTERPDEPASPASEHEGAATAAAEVVREEAAAEADAAATADADAEEAADADADTDTEDATASAQPASSLPETLGGHVAAAANSGTVRLLDGEYGIVSIGEAEECFDLVHDAVSRPETVVVDGELTQRVLDVAAQRGVGRVVARELGEFTKRPTSVRVQTFDQFDT
jgi:DNA primase